MSINKLVEEARENYEKGKAILDSFEGEELPAEKEAEVDKFFDAAEELKAKADRKKKRSDLESYLEQPERKRPTEKPEAKMGAPVEQKSPSREEQHKTAFDSYIKSKEGVRGLSDVEMKTLNSLRDPEGGYVVPEEYATDVIKKLDDIVHLRSLATTMQVGAATVNFPTVDSDIDVDWINELVDYPVDSDEPFGKTQFNAQSLKVVVKVTEELLEDSFLNLASLISQEGARAYAEIEEIGFIRGTGNNQPLGLLEAGLNTVDFNTGDDHQIVFGDMSRYWIIDAMDLRVRVLDQTYADEGRIGYKMWKRTDGSPTDYNAFSIGEGDTIDTDAILDIEYSVKAQYRRNGSFLMHRNTIKEVRKLKDDNGQLIWQPGLQAGEPATLSGFPVAESEFMPDPEA